MSNVFDLHSDVQSKPQAQKEPNKDLDILTLKKMVIDEERINVFTKYCTTTGQKDVIESDHNTLSCEFNIKYSRELNKPRIESFDFKGFSLD